MLSDKDYRKLVVDNVKDPGVRAFWVDEFAKYNERYMQEAGDAIKNKIGQFTANPIIRNIIGQPKSSFDIRKMMDEKKILIMNLSKGLIGESNANLLGSMLTTRIYLAAMSRADLPPEKMREMPNFYFYVDEFQSFANATFANILSEARKYHLNLTIAHQYITQMEEEVRDAVFGNVGTIISFRVGPLDAELLETIFTPQFLATDIVNLSFAQVYLTLMIDGIGSAPFSATTMPPIAPPAQSCKDMAISASRQAFTRSRESVEIDIHKFHEPVVVPKKIVKPVLPEAVVRTGETAPERIAPIDAQKTPSIVTERRTVMPQRRSTDVPRQQQGERRQTDIPKVLSKPVQNGEDLRSALKKLVQKEESATDSRQPQEKIPVRDMPKPELKQALQSVLANIAEKQEPPVIAHVPVVPLEAKVNTHNEVTPKELERMMRVTTSDKPPL
jgi:hypothetical protein